MQAAPQARQASLGPEVLLALLEVRELRGHPVHLVDPGVPVQMALMGSLGQWECLQCTAIGKISGEHVPSCPTSETGGARRSGRGARGGGAAFGCGCRG